MNPRLTDSERQSFDRDGFLFLPEVLPTAVRERMSQALRRIVADVPGSAVNLHDIFALDPVFLDLLDRPEVLLRVRDLLGWNLWVNTAQLAINRPSSQSGGPQRAHRGWHRDSSQVVDDLKEATPRLAVKVAFYLSDLNQEQAGQTHFIRGSHVTLEPPPGGDEMPERAVPVKGPAGSIVLFDTRTLHSAATPNTTPVPREAIFVQYAYRWLVPATAVRGEIPEEGLTPLRRQLLGLSSESKSVSHFQGLSGRYYPRPHETPLRYLVHDVDPRRERFGRRVRRALGVLLGRS
jgi:hypothetical protein